MHEKPQIESSTIIPINAGSYLRFVPYVVTSSSYTLQIRADILMPDGTINYTYRQFQVSVVDYAVPRTIKLTNGQLLAASISAPNTILQDGELYVELDVQNGDVNAAEGRIHLISGYLSGANALDYPLGLSKAINDTRGASTSSAFGDPAVGADFTANFSGVAYNKIIGGTFTFAASAAVANRTIDILISDISGNAWRGTANAVVTASQTRVIYLSNVPIPAVIPANTLYVPIPNLPYLRSAVIASSTNNIQAGDQYSLIIMRSLLQVAI